MVKLKKDPKQTQEIITIGPEAQKIQWLAEQRLFPWIIRVIPDGALEEYYDYPIKVEKLTSPILLPMGAQKRIRAFQGDPEVVINVEDWWVVKEIKPLPKPWLTDDQKRTIAHAAKVGLKVTGVTLAAVAVVAGAVLMVGLAVAGAVAQGIGMAMCGKDPAILARVKRGDGTFEFVEIFRYWEL